MLLFIFFSIFRLLSRSLSFFFFFFFNDTATTEIYTLSLHDALPILRWLASCSSPDERRTPKNDQDRKSTRLNSSHQKISYAVFCLKKKKKKTGGLDRGEMVRNGIETVRGVDGS